MSKQLRSVRHKRMRAALVDARNKADVTQRELARRLKRAHSYVGRIEMGDRRLDLPEFCEWCELIDADPLLVLAQILRRRIWLTPPKKNSKL